MTISSKARALILTTAVVVTAGFAAQANAGTLDISKPAVQAASGSAYGYPLRTVHVNAFPFDETDTAHTLKADPDTGVKHVVVNSTHNNWGNR